MMTVAAAALGPVAAIAVQCSCKEEEGQVRRPKIRGRWENGSSPEVQLVNGLAAALLRNLF